jgi:hypothetical protein
MSKQVSKKSPPTPSKQLANVCDSLADDVLAGYIDSDEDTIQRGVQALGVIFVAMGGSFPPPHMAPGDFVAEPPPGELSRDLVIGDKRIRLTLAGSFDPGKSHDFYEPIRPDSSTPDTREKGMKKGD